MREDNDPNDAGRYSSFLVGLVRVVIGSSEITKDSRRKVIRSSGNEFMVYDTY